jgi:hypothetical protein
MHQSPAPSERMKSRRSRISIFSICKTEVNVVLELATLPAAQKPCSLYLNIGLNLLRGWIHNIGKVKVLNI